MSATALSRLLSPSTSRRAVFGLVVGLAAFGAAAPARAAALNAEDAALVRKANDYFNSIRTMVADFDQVGADGRPSKGELYVLKPGKLRFIYAKPSPIDIVADGRSVAVRDRKLGTQDLYLIGQTPLKFLLKGSIDLARDTKVLDVENTDTAVAITIEDKATMGGTSRIRLVFDPAPFALKQWSVADPQGGDTVVTLSNIDLATKPEASNFVIEQSPTKGRER